MICLWSPRNEEHIAKHGVQKHEATYVVETAEPPYPEAIGEGKESAWGKTKHGRYLQVIFVQAALEDVEPDEFERLELHEKIALQDGERAIRIIHARELEQSEKRLFRRRKRGRP